MEHIIEYITLLKVLCIISFAASLIIHRVVIGELFSIFLPVIFLACLIVTPLFIYAFYSFKPLILLIMG